MGKEQIAILNREVRGGLTEETFEKKLEGSEGESLAHT